MDSKSSMPKMKQSSNPAMSSVELKPSTRGTAPRNCGSLIASWTVWKSSNTLMMVPANKSRRSTSCAATANALSCTLL
eukprot:2835021-Prymnesium_polylepis.1